MLNLDMWARRSLTLSIRCNTCPDLCRTVQASLLASVGAETKPILCHEWACAFPLWTELWWKICKLFFIFSVTACMQLQPHLPSFFWKRFIAAVCLSWNELIKMCPMCMVKCTQTYNISVKNRIYHAIMYGWFNPQTSHIDLLSGFLLAYIASDVSK